METPKEYYYTYYSYEEWGRGYFGSRKCYCFPKEDVKYLGSSKDKTFKPKYKIILKDDYATREEAYADEIILQEYYKVVENPHFANRCYQTTTRFYVPTEQARENVKKSHQTQRELGIGVHGLSKEEWIERNREINKKSKELGIGFYGFTKEQRSEISKKGGKVGGNKTYELGVGIHGLTPEQVTKNCKKGGKKGGKKSYELGVGIHGQTKEQRKESGRKGGSIGGKIVGKRAKELGLGIFSLTKEEKVEIGKKSAKIINAQRWECCETGYISTAAGVVSYQKARGIDTSKTNRRRIS